MKALLKTGLVAAICLSGSVAFGQEPVKKVEASKAPATTEPVKAAPEKQAQTTAYPTLSLPAGSTAVPAEGNTNTNAAPAPTSRQAAPTNKTKPVVRGTREKAPVEPARKQEAAPVR